MGLGYKLWEHKISLSVNCIWFLSNKYLTSDMMASLFMTGRSNPKVLAVSLTLPAAFYGIIVLRNDFKSG